MFKYILAPFSVLYCLGYAINKRLVKAKTLPGKVISVGNITWGGAGKTSAVIKLADDILQLEKKPAILTRGYKRKWKAEIENRKDNVKMNSQNISTSTGIFMKRIQTLLSAEIPLVVSDGASPDEAGDEPYMLAEQLKNVPVIVGSDRYKSGVFAIEKFEPDVFILDDGFQHWGLARDLDIVCVNAINPFGNGLLIPSGILREPLSALSRADLILITNVNIVPVRELDRLRKEISIYTKAPTVLVANELAGIINIFNGESKKITENERIVAFSAIGSNENFKMTLESLGYTPQKFYSFLDHHRYKASDLKKIVEENPCCIFLTTRKDAVKIKFFKQHYDNFYYFDIRIKIIEGEDIWRKKIKQLF